MKYLIGAIFIVVTAIVLMNSNNQTADTKKENLSKNELVQNENLINNKNEIKINLQEKEAKQQPDKAPVERLSHLKEMGVTIMDENIEIPEELKARREHIRKMELEEAKQRVAQLEKEKLEKEIGDMVRSQEIPLEYIDEYHQRVVVYEPFYDGVNWDINSINRRQQNINNIVEVKVNTATFLNNIKDIKEIEFTDAEGGVHILKFDSIETFLDMHVISFVNRTGNAVITISKHLDKMNGVFQVNGRIHTLKTKGNVGYVYN